jgi:hypothetical protein
MKKLMATFFAFYLGFASIAASSDALELKMSLDDTFLVQETDDWRVEIVKQLSLSLADVRITPKHGYDFSMMLYFKCDTKDLAQFDSPEKIAESVRRSSEQYLPFTTEKKIVLRAVPLKTTYGSYTIFTDAKVAARTSRNPGEFKYLTRGMLRISKDSALGFSIMTNDINSEEYKRLLAYVYSFVKPLR